MFTSDNTRDAEMNHRLASAKVAPLRLPQAKLWSSRALSLPTKLHFLQSIVMSVLLVAPATYSYLVVGKLGRC